MFDDFYNPLRWTPEMVSRFWDHWSNKNDLVYFGRMFGPVVISLAEKNHWLETPIVDVGCGPGHLLELLAQKGLRCEGVEWSEQSIESALNRCSQYAAFGGVSKAEDHRIALSDESAGTVILMEVLEHLLDDQISKTLAEIRRVLKPGGRLIVTTPSAEDLSKSTVGCPNCGAVFHSVQHMRSLTEEDVARMLETAGFRVSHVASYNFGIMMAPRAFRVLRAVKDAVRKRRASKPHLLCVAQKL